MENMENLVAEQVTENVEQTTEQTPKMFTQDEVNEIVGKAKARTKAKIEKDYQRRYGGIESVLKAGMGKEDIGEIEKDLREFYGKKPGIKMPQEPNYSQRDLEVLAKAEAEDIIRMGYEDVVEETDRLAAIGIANMTAREKAVFKTLAEHRQAEERRTALSGLGASEDTINSPEFKEFQKLFKADTPIEKVYETFKKTQPQKEIHTTGSMKHTAKDTGVKDYYSYEEASKFTKEDFDKNPALFKAVERSMAKW